MAAKRPKPFNRAAFIESMECLPVTEITKGPEWTYEIKLDGFRLEAVKYSGETLLYSRRNNVLNKKFHYIAEALAKLPNATVIDGEVVALDEKGRSSFTLLQNFRSAEARIHYYAFDILIHRGQLLLDRPLAERRTILEKVLPPNDHISLSAVDHCSSASTVERT